MNCPRLPAVPPARVSQIEPSWFQTLNECLEYAMSHPRGDGFTILQDAAGSLRTSDSDGSGGGSILPEYDGMFAVRAVNQEDRFEISVGGGRIEIEGTAIRAEEFEPVALDADNGGDAFVILTISADCTLTLSVEAEPPAPFSDGEWHVQLASLFHEDGAVTVRQDQYGIIRLWRPGMGWGLFRTEIRDGRIFVGAGFAWLNGTVKPVAAADLAAGTGYLCVAADFDNDAGWGYPRIEFAAPDETHFPVAFIGKGKNGVPEVLNFGVSLAILTVTAVCPIAAGSEE